MIATILSLVQSILLGHLWLVLLFSLPLFYIYVTRNHDYWRKRGVPGPQNYPLFGSFFSLTRPISLLYGDYIKQYGKVCGIFQGQNPALLVADPELIKKILVKDFHLFRNRTAFGQEPRTRQSTNLVDSRDEAWKRIRSIVTPMFTTAKLRKMEPQMKACTKTMLDSLEDLAQKKQEFLAHQAMGNFTMDVIAKCAFATDTDANDENNAFVKNARSLLNFRSIPFFFSQTLPFYLYKLLSDLNVPFVKAFGGSEFFIGLSHHLIQQRKALKEKGEKTPEDLLQMMINAEHSIEEKEVDKADLLEAHHVNSTNEELEAQKNYFKEIIGSKYLLEGEIIEQGIVFFVAGYETTASTLTFCLFELATNPEVQQKLHTEIQQAKAKDPILSYAETLQALPYLDAVLSETLRKYPPAVIVINRECTADEYKIPEYDLTLHKGDTVIFPVYAIHHNEEFHPEPERFNPGRFLPENRHQLIPYTYLPFGSGPRNCVGMRFALEEAKIALANMIDQFEILRTPKTPNQLKLELGTSILKTEPVYIKVKRRVK